MAARDDGAAGARFAAYLGRWRPTVETALDEAARRALASTPAEAPTADLERFLYGPLAAFTAGGGKRVRPVLALLGAEAVGAEPTCALAVAVAIEHFQTAALVHDDIADHGELRRGEPCLHVSEGEGLAINVGDAALTSVFTDIAADASLDAELRLALLGELATMAQRTLEGQALDIGWARDGRWDISEADYRFMATCKTAHYSAATPLVCGALCGGGEAEQVEALRAFGLAAGLAFQLHDDLLNLCGDAAAQGKDYRSDITEGKRTLLAVGALARLGGEQRAELLALLSAGTAVPADLARAAALIEASGAADHVRREARELVRSAKAQLAAAELAPQARATLESMADFFVERAG